MITRQSLLQEKQFMLKAACLICAGSNLIGENHGKSTRPAILLGKEHKGLVIKA